MLGFGPRGPEIVFDRLCRGPKFDFLPLGTTKKPQNPKKTTNNVKNPGFWGYTPGIQGNLGILRIPGILGIPGIFKICRIPRNP